MSLTLASSSGFQRPNILAILAEGVILSSGWRRRMIAFVSGAVGALALPPLSLFWAIAAPLTVAVWLIDGSHDLGDSRPRTGALRAAFSAGWWMGFGYFLAGLWWLGAAFLVEADKFAWALPLGVLALPAALALFPASGFALARLLWSPGPARILALAFGLGIAEWSRCLLFTGFPWNDIGMSLGGNLALAQIASVIGLHGLTFVAIAIFAAPATLWRFQASRFQLAPVIAGALTLALIAGFGEYRLRAPPSPDVKGVRLRLIQPNVSQGASFAPENKDAILHRYLALSRRAPIPERSDAGAATHLIWPESAFPFILSRDAQALGDIADFLRDGAILITGAARVENYGGGEPRYFNSIEILTSAGLARERYDKQHLVPFGEYVPFEAVLQSAGVSQFVRIPGGFAAGSGRRALHVPGLPDAMPLICYEAIFPVEIGDQFTRAERPRWMLNVTDDAWFGRTPGPYQHYAQARLRAIELGLPLVRAANSGISAVVDGFGRETASTTLGTEDVLDAGLPEPIAPTWQSRFGSLGAALIALLLLAGSLTARRRA